MQATFSGEPAEEQGARSCTGRGNAGRDVKVNMNCANCNRCAGGACSDAIGGFNQSEVAITGQARVVACCLS